MMMRVMMMMALLACAAVGADGLRDSFTLKWDDPAGEPGTNAWDQVDGFILYYLDTLEPGTDTNAPPKTAAWQVLARLSFQEAIDAGEIYSVDYAYRMSNQVARLRFYVVTATNWWGESAFSNVAFTPAVPQIGKLGIE